MAFITTAEVRNIIGVNDTSVIPDATITQAIEFALDELDRLTFTTYLPNEDDGSVTSATTTTLVDSSKEWTDDEWIGYAVYIYAGKGSGQIREITDNDATTFTVATWTTTPDSTSKYLITYLNKVTEKFDGTGTNSILIKNYPLIQVDSLTIDGTSISLDKIHVYKNLGKIVLDPLAEKNRFTSPSDISDYKSVEITYHWGILPEYKRGSLRLPGYVKRMVGIIAGLQAIAYQVGGTYATPSTYSLPNLNVSIGQAYVNIREVSNMLLADLETLKQEAIGKNPYMV